MAEVEDSPFYKPPEEPPAPSDADVAWATIKATEHLKQIRMYVGYGTILVFAIAIMVAIVVFGGVTLTFEPDS